MQNMKRLYRIAAVAFLAIAAVSCSRSAHISGVVQDAPHKDVIVRLLDVSTLKDIDTLKTDAKGRYRYNVKLDKGQPEFIYLYYKDTKIASLLLQRGDKVNVISDTVGTYSVKGSEETDKLSEIETSEADFNNKYFSLLAKLSDLDQSSAEATSVKHELTSMYISYYREKVRYVIENSHSLTSIPVLYQTVGNGIPVFGQTTDALHFRNVYDSLMTVYPESRYVKALGEEAKRRQQILTMGARIGNAEESGFPDIELADTKGNKVKLSSLRAKVVMIYFWDSSDAAQKMFNLDVMKPLYADFHSKGFDIYSVSLSTDKAAWASVVKGQNLPWTNVCDGLGMASPVIGLYNVSALPNVYFIVDGEIVASPNVKDASTLRAFISSKL